MVKSPVKSSVLLFLFVLSIVGPIVYEAGSQQESRYALTAALWENGSVRVDGFVQIMGHDAALREGHYYSDKAPLQPFSVSRSTACTGRLAASLRRLCGVPRTWVCGG